ncbi:MAG: iron dicitrate transport regulator FecR [Alicyclobacillus sp.]|nr:iron dicitrate transport regulator FecR [Alicyclobacillus sp.]
MQRVQTGTGTPVSLPQIREWAANCRFLVALTGAGISRASGLPLLQETIEDVPLSEFFRPALWQQDPARYYELYRRILSEWRHALPNAAHRALALRNAWVITQNIDGLHRDAGTRHLLELHGNIRELLCPTCDLTLNSQLVWTVEIPRCPQCQNVLHPGITLEGEPVRHIALATDWAGRAELFLVIGTQLAMEPVRALPDIARQNGALVVWLNEAAERAVPHLLGIQPSAE